MSHYQDPRDQYYNNQSQYQGEYVGEYRQEHYIHPQMQENNHFYSNTGTPADDNDNASVVSSVYSQPSDIGTSPSNYAQYYQGQSHTMEPRQQPLQQPLSYNDDEPMDYPPSPFAASTNTHSSAVGLTTASNQQGLPSYDQNEKSYIPNYGEENQYNEYSPNSKSQFNVYNDFNNIRKDESYDDEDTRNNTLIGTNGNSYTMNINSDGLPSTGKANRHSTTGEHFVVPNKKRRCAFCTRKICVIITFVMLFLLGGGMYFVWPRVPKIEILPPTAVGDAEITLNPTVSAKMQMDLQIELDNRENWLSYKFKSFKVDVFNAERLSSYNRPITSAEKKGFSISGKAKTTISVPIAIDYSVSEKNDPIVQDFISACTKPPEGESRTPLNFRFDIKMFIAGLDWVYKPTKIIPVSTFQCPFEAVRPSPEAPADEPVVEPEQATEPAQPEQPATEPPKDPATNPAKEPEQPATEPPKDPNAPAPDPATDPAKEPAQPEQPEQPATDPAKEPAQPEQPATEPPQDPNAPAPDPATDPATPAT